MKNVKSSRLFPQEINFHPKNAPPKKPFLSDPKRSLRFFRANLASLAQQRYTLLKFLNIIKQREYYFERFFRSHNSIFEAHSQEQPPIHSIRACLNFFEEMDNFYQSDARRLEILRKGISLVLFQSLLSLRRPLLALLGSFNPSRPVPSRLRTQRVSAELAVSGASFLRRRVHRVAGFPRVAGALYFVSPTRPERVWDDVGPARTADADPMGGD